MRRTLLILGLLVAWSAVGRCQSPAPAASLPQAAVADKPAEHSAQKAMLLSLLPGAGQVYNGQAWKLPIIYGAFAGVGYFVYTNYTDMAKLKKEYLHRVQEGAPEWDKYADYPDMSIYNMYQSSNKRFQIFVIASVAVYGLNLLDAYVFGHLYDFQINDDLALQLAPAVAPDWNSSTGVAPALQLSLRF